MERTHKVFLLILVTAIAIDAKTKKQRFQLTEHKNIKRNIDKQQTPGKDNPVKDDVIKFKDFDKTFNEKIRDLKAMGTVYQKHCELMGRYQTGIIDTLSVTHEYGQEIHHLHHTIKTMHRELKTLQQRVNTMGTDAFLSNHLDLLPQKEQSHIKHAMVEFEKQATQNISDIVSKATLKQYGEIEKKLSKLEKQVQDDKALLMDKDKQLQSLEKKTNLKDKTIREQTEVIDALKERMDWVEKLLIKMYRKRNKQEREQMQAAKRADCPTGFFRFAMSCYKFENLTMNWKSAEQYCQDRHEKAHLISIETAEENNFVLSYRKYNHAKWSSPWLWTGGTDVALEGIWKWVGTDKTFGFTYWTDGEPNGDKRQNCLYFTGGGKQTWDDWDCESLRINFVCEIVLDEKA